MNVFQRLWVTGCTVAVAGCALCPPWRIHVIQKGDDRSVAWRSAPVWGESGFAPPVLAAVATRRLGVSVPSSEVEARLHGERAWLQLGGVMGVAVLGWCALADGRRRSVEAVEAVEAVEGSTS